MLKVRTFIWFLKIQSIHDLIIQTINYVQCKTKQQKKKIVTCNKLVLG